MRTLAFALVLLLPASAPAEPREYAIAPSQGNRLALEVFKTRLMRGKKHLFLFDRYRGTLLYDPDRPEASRVQLLIEAASAVLKDTWLSEKDFQKVQAYALNDMLAAERYPEIRFASTGVRATGAAQYLVDGALTIRGITRPVRVHVTSKPASGSPSFEGSAEIKMTGYGLQPPSAALGMVGTRDEMAFSFVLTPEPSDGPPALNEADQHRRDRDNQQDMNEASERVRAHHSQQPKYQ